MKNSHPRSNFHTLLLRIVRHCYESNSCPAEVFLLQAVHLLPQELPCVTWAFTHMSIHSLFCAQLTLLTSIHTCGKCTWIVSIGWSTCWQMLPRIGGFYLSLSSSRRLKTFKVCPTVQDKMSKAFSNSRLSQCLQTVFPLLEPYPFKYNTAILFLCFI